MSLYHLIYFIAALTAVFIQARSRVLQDLPAEMMTAGLQGELDGLLRKRRFMSPFIAGLTALLILLITLRYGLWKENLPLTFIPVWALASLGDVFIEGAYSISDKKKQDRFYLTGMVIFMGMTVLLGAGLINNALKTPLPLYAHITAVALPLAVGAGAFTTLKLDRDTLVPMIVYDLAVSVLFCGGLYSLFAGEYQLAYIGIGYFLSDWLVGLRDFGRRKPRFLERWNLLLILLLYYSIMMMSVDAVLKLV